MEYSIKELSRRLSERLSETILDPEQRWFEIELMIGHVLKRDRTWVALHPDTPLSETEAKTSTELVERRLMLEPLAYLFQQAPFFGTTFFVDQRVLIPRPETEQLVQRAIDFIQNTHQSWAVWDVGTGSGCIALSLAHTFPGAPILASDQSDTALTVAQENARRLNIQNTTFIQGSLLTSEIIHWLKQHTDKRWLITANLPYLPNSDAPTMQAQVTDYEPHSALFAPGDGLRLITNLLNDLHPLLAERAGDVILLEHDPRQASALLTFANRHFPKGKIATERDQNGAERFTVLEL